ncbi:OmpA family protein [Granulosicoccus sp.]|nr:OmpA family protein [Granulosicoccus sp.]MDB4224311.1 OmpA family protein [Granulosicoccus sp.]
MSGSTQRAIALAIGMTGGMMFSSHAFATWYVGFGGGMSKLSPDTAGSTFTLEEDAGQAAFAFVGLDINDWLSAEAAFTDLGAAGLSGEQEIAYTSASIGGIAYVYKNRGMDARQSGMAGYVRLGLNSITNESEILLNEADNTAVWIGAGIQFPIGARLGLRAEIASYDGDAQAAVASIYWRGKADARSRGGLLNGGELPQSTVSRSNTENQGTGFDEVEPFDGYDTSTEQTRGGGQRFDKDRLDTGTTGISNNFDTATSASCDTPASGEPTDATGCALFTGVVEGVEFQVGGSSLTPDSEFVLESLSLSLNNHPSLVIELQVHTEAFAEEGLAMRLSRERVLTVARFLAKQGVDVQRLRARAFGSAQPRFETNSTESRRLNNRIALRVL